MIQHQTDVYSWDFVFVGANQDSFEVAKQYNIPLGNTLNFECSERGFNKMSHTLKNVTTNTVAYCAGKFENYDSKNLFTNQDSNNIEAQTH